MTNEPFDQSQSLAADGASSNPYQAPTPSAAQPSDTADLADQIPRLSSVPGADFWAVAVLGLSLLGIATFLTYGLAAPVVLAFAAGIVRACIITWQRARRRLVAKSPIPVLFSSTALSLLLILGCTIAYGGICTGIVFSRVTDGPGIGALMITATVGGFATFIFLFIRSIKWAM